MKICISNKFPGDGDAPGLGTRLWESRDKPELFNMVATGA